MKLNIISDLHCLYHTDFGVNWLDFKPELLEPADYLIVAGDSGYSTTEPFIHKELREKTKGKFKAVLTIKGNHSYWVPDHNGIASSGDPEVSEADMMYMAPNDKIELVDGGVAIIGTTLWTPETNWSEIRCMNDYRYIPNFAPEVKEARFKEESEWLRATWKKYSDAGLKTVIVTHHNPRHPRDLVEYSREHEDVSTAYWVCNHSLDDIKPNLWICGHIHEDIDTEIDGVRFVRHPIGYRWGELGIFYTQIDAGKRIAESWYNKIVEI